MSSGLARDPDVDPYAVTAIFGVAVALFVLSYVTSLVLWFAGQFSGLLVHGEWSPASARNSFSILFNWPTHFTDPSGAWPAAAQSAVGPAWLMYPIFLLLMVPLGILVFFAGQMGLRFRRHREFRRLRLGFADGGEVNRLLSARAVRKKAKSVRPSYKKKSRFSPLEVGYFLGKDIRSRRKLYCSAEDVMLVVAPPRQGKDVHFCIPNIIDAMGSCVATTTRTDMFSATVSAREKVGQVHVFDPNKMTNWPSQMRWSPVNGCEDALIASNRAAALVHGAGVGEGVQNASYWTGVATAILRCYLHAAALGGRTVADVVRWSQQPTNQEPIRILRAMETPPPGSPYRAAPGWAAELEASASTDGETRGNMWAGVRRALDCLSDPDVLAACSPGPDEVFSIVDFVKGRNTLYVLGKEKKHGSVAPLITAMMEDIFDQVRKIATKMPKSRIDPPLTVELNEVAHIAPMPNLPGYMGDSGGFSIALHIYLQSLAQARSKWGKDDAEVMWDTAAIRVIMGGSGQVNDLEDISRLLGEADERTRSVTKGSGGRSVSISKQKRRVLSIDEIRTLKFGTAVVIARSARPVEVVLTPWWKRKDGKKIASGQDRVEEIIKQAPKTPFVSPLASLVNTGGAGASGATSQAAPPNSADAALAAGPPPGTGPIPGNGSTSGGPATNSSQGGEAYGTPGVHNGTNSANDSAFQDLVGHPISAVPNTPFDLASLSGFPGFDPVSGMPASGIPTSGIPASGTPASGLPAAPEPKSAPPMPGPFPPAGPGRPDLSPPPDDLLSPPGQATPPPNQAMPLQYPTSNEQQQPEKPGRQAAAGWGAPRRDDEQ